MKKLTTINPVIFVIVFLTAFFILETDKALCQSDGRCPFGHKDDENVVTGKIRYTTAAGIDTVAKSGNVKLFKVNPPSLDVIAVDSARINSATGIYTITNVPPGEYYIVAYPNDKDEDFMLSFYPSGPLWNTASRIIITPGPWQVRTCNISTFRLTFTGGATPVQGETADSANHNYKLRNSVIIAKSGNEYRGFAITNNQGKYLVNSIVPGNYIMTATRFGYKNFSQVATITTSPSTINFYMARDTSPSISVNSNETVVKNFKLMQNYPNPFNPSTEIAFTLEKGMNVKLAVYSIEGKIIKELVSGYRGQGEYKVNFSADNLSSGIYNYVLETESGQRESKLMVFTK